MGSGWLGALVAASDGWQGAFGHQATWVMGEGGGECTLRGWGTGTLVPLDKRLMTGRGLTGRGTQDLAQEGSAITPRVNGGAEVGRSSALSVGHRS